MLMSSGLLRGSGVQEEEEERRTGSDRTGKRWRRRTRRGRGQSRRMMTMMMICEDRWVQTLSVLKTLPSGWHGVFLLVIAFRRFLRSSWCRFGATGSTWGYLRSSIGSWGHMRAVSGHGVLLGLSTGQLGVTGCISGSRGRIGFVLGSWKHRGAMYVKRGFMGSLRNHPGATKPLIIFAWRVCRGVILGPRWVHRPILGSRGYPMPSFQSRRTGSQTAQVSPTLDGGCG